MPPFSNFVESGMIIQKRYLLSTVSPSRIARGVQIVPYDAPFHPEQELLYPVVIMMGRPLSQEEKEIRQLARKNIANHIQKATNSNLLASAKSIIKRDVLPYSISYLYKGAIPDLSEDARKHLAQDNIFAKLEKVAVKTGSVSDLASYLTLTPDDLKPTIDIQGELMAKAYKINAQMVRNRANDLEGNVGRRNQHAKLAARGNNEDEIAWRLRETEWNLQEKARKLREKVLARTVQNVKLDAKRSGQMARELTTHVNVLRSTLNQPALVGSLPQQSKDYSQPPLQPTPLRRTNIVTLQA